MRSKVWLIPLLSVVLHVTSVMGQQKPRDAKSLEADKLQQEAEGLLKSRRFKEAEMQLRRSIKIKEGVLGTQAVELVEPLNLVAQAIASQGDYTEARKVYERVRQIKTDHYGANDLETARSTFNLGLMLTYEGNYVASKRVIEEVPEQTSTLLSFFRSGKSLRAAYGLLFSWKGLFTDLLRRQTIIARMELDPTHRPLVDRLRTVRTEIASLYQGGIGLQPDAQQRYEALTREKESLERELSRFVGAEQIRDPLDVTFEQFQKVLTKDEIFVDIYRYEYSSQGKPVEDRYAAVIVKPTGDPVLVDIGSAKVVERAVTNWLSEVLLGNDGKNAWISLARNLKTVLPSIMHNHSKIWISPDATLARIPWQLFADEGRSEFDIVVSQIDSARELFALRQLGTAKNIDSQPTFNLVGDLHYGSTSNSGAEVRLFESLSGSRQEITDLERLGHEQGMRILKLKENEATKSEVQSLAQQSTFIHWATHSFFYKARETLVPNESLGRNPLVESGVALSEANSRDPITFEAKGLLTGEEITGWDLSKASLVTLSACNSGRGEENTGQGISGLRSAVIAAGARSIVMSLWKVPDESTAQFMKLFYTNLWEKKLSKAKSLLLAQKELREDKSGKYRRPIHWGAWVIAGDAW